MKKEEFLVALEDILQTDEPVAADENLADNEVWDSLSKMAVMAYYKKEFDISLNLKDLKEVNNVEDLIKLAGDNIQ